MTQEKLIHSGNAFDDGKFNRSWFVGHFIKNENSIRHDEDVEVKLSEHTKGEKRREENPRTDGKTMTMLISGEFEISMPDNLITLRKLGDYVIWGPGIRHSWECKKDRSQMLTIRWPSKEEL